MIGKRGRAIRWLATVSGIVLTAGISAESAVYEVGPGKDLRSIGDVPWELLQAGDVVRIHWREEPYHEKFVIAAQGTAAAPIVVTGVPGAGGALPVLDGRGATTRTALAYGAGARGVIKIGASTVPADVMPRHIIVENLEIRSARQPYTFVGPDGSEAAYQKNASAIYLEKGEHITIRNCVFHDCGNGFFCARSSADVLVEGCRIYGNGAEGSIYEHNNYTSANGILFQYNYFGRLREGCGGNNLKDRSAGTVIRYNWINGGNRQLDLVESGSMRAHPSYRDTHVYGNVLVEFDGEGNRQMIHYGGDNGREETYRKGTLHFYNNTVVSTRTGRTTLLRLSTKDERADVRNNIIYTTAPGANLDLLSTSGRLELRNNWLKAGWVAEFGSETDGSVVDGGGNVTGDDPGFLDFAAQNFSLRHDSPCSDISTDPATGHPVLKEYVRHRRSRPRPAAGPLDAGAYERPIDRPNEGGGS